MLLTTCKQCMKIAFRTRKMATSGNRVLVNFVRDNNRPVKAKFTESILDTLGLITGNDMPLYAELKDNRMLLGNKRWSPCLEPVKMRRPAFCPIHNMTEVQETELPEETSCRGIDVGCAVILETADGKILLTRRASHLKTFPGVWVPPGGHVEFGETLKEAGMRELREETGLDLYPENCLHGDTPILAMWESAYPAKLSSGIPKRHHAVVYLYAKLTSELTSTHLHDKLHCDPNEVGAVTWIDRSLAKAIVTVTEEESSQGLVQKLVKQLPQTIPIIITEKDSPPVTEDLKTSVLLQTAPGGSTDIERVSTGTKFAIEEWLHYQHYKH